MTTLQSSDHDAQVLIVGGGPVGLTLSALLSAQGVTSRVLEADEGYCSGSRAICISRRSQEILGWIGADQALRAKGLPWVGGRSFYRDTEVLHFTMPSDPGERFAPMVNLQQFHIEAIVHQAMQRLARQGGAACSVQWGSEVTAVRPHADHVAVDVACGSDTLQTQRARWLVACDGGRSTVRSQLGLQLEGVQYDGRYVIVDIRQATRRSVERLAWFDPPSNPGSTLLMHRQPGDVWRIDYQLRDDEDPDEAVKPENVLPRVAAHLRMIGEDAPWEPLWISLYNAKCLTLPRYVHGLVLFAGDAAHLVPIFGVRGLNSGLDDAGNLAWKLAAVVQGRAAATLLDSYSQERVHAARQNIAYGAKSTEFMAPPNAAFRLLREATLRLASVDAGVRSLINPRQSEPVAYDGSPLNLTDEAAPASTPRLPPACAPGRPAPEVALNGPAPAVSGACERRLQHLTQAFGHGWTLLHFTARAALPTALARWVDQSTPRLQALCLGAAEPAAWAAYGATEGTTYLVRPDGYIAARCRGVPTEVLSTEVLSTWQALLAAAGCHSATAAPMQPSDPFCGETTP